MARTRVIKVYLTEATYDLIAEEAQARGESGSEFLAEAGIVRAAILRARRRPDEMVLVEDVDEAVRRYTREVALRARKPRSSAA
jgi:hypothetical protein